MFTNRDDDLGDHNHGHGDEGLGHLQDEDFKEAGKSSAPTVEGTYIIGLIRFRV